MNGLRNYSSGLVPYLSAGIGRPSLTVRRGEILSGKLQKPVRIGQ